MASVRRRSLPGILGLLAAGSMAAFIFWATVTWLSAVMPAFLFTATWLIVVVLLLRGRPLQNIAIVALSLVASGAAVELLLRGLASAGGLVELPNQSRWELGRSEVISPPFRVYDPQLGLRHEGPNRVRATVRRYGEVVYDAHYTLDAAGFRTTPGNRQEGHPILVMGDSFHFGDGIEDDQTVSAHLVRRSAGALRPFNLAVSGYGPHQVLRQLELGTPAAVGPQRYDWLLLDVIDDYVPRASGRPTWQWNSPRYEISEGRVRLAGAFAKSAFATNMLLQSRAAALLVRALNQDPDGDRRRFVAIMREIRILAKERYGAELLVLYHVGRDFRSGEPIAGLQRNMLVDLCEAGISYVDLASRIAVDPKTAHQFYIPGDGHPTSQLNERVAALAIGYIGGKELPDACPAAMAAR